MLLLLLLACVSPKDDDSDTGVPVDWPTGVDLEALTSTLEDLSSPDLGGRLTGTPAGQPAEDAVVAHLQASGFEPVLQEVPMQVWEVGTPVDLTLLDGAGEDVLPLAYIDQYREVAWSGSGAATGDVVFVGDGYASDYEGLDVTGRIVAFLGSFSIESQYHEAADRGAAGVLLLPTGDLGDYDAWYGEVLIPKVYWDWGGIDPADLRPDLPALMVRRSAVDDLFGASISDLEADPTPREMGVRVRMELHGTAWTDTTCNNVFAWIQGTGESILGLGAHYDHIGTGADGTVWTGASDNASGTAAILEVARALGALPVPPETSVFLALWCGEEQGIFGSTHYVQQDPLWPLEDTGLYVNLDNISDYPGPYLVRASESELQETFLAPGADLEIEEQDIGFVCGSDECPFYEDADIPFLRYMSFGDIGHTREDTFENASPVDVGRVADATLRGALAVAWGR